MEVKATSLRPIHMENGRVKKSIQINSDDDKLKTQYNLHQKLVLVNFFTNSNQKKLTWAQIFPTLVYFLIFLVLCQGFFRSQPFKVIRILVLRFPVAMCNLFFSIVSTE